MTERSWVQTPTMETIFQAPFIWIKAWNKNCGKTLTWHCCMCCNPANGRVDFEEWSAYKIQLHGIEWIVSLSVDKDQTPKKKKKKIWIWMKINKFNEIYLYRCFLHWILVLCLELLRNDCQRRFECRRYNLWSRSSLSSNIELDRRTVRRRRRRIRRFQGRHFCVDRSTTVSIREKVADLCCGGDGSRSWSRWRTRVSTSQLDSATSSTSL